MNRLASESSPYLLQHRDNPVDWYPWGEEAFARARAEDRPVLLSVGYSACHWCHVMAHECFEDPELAALQNRLFVSIKVDREERPDVDRVYMDALQAMTGQGGWPMTLALLPDGRPFFAGTYFPPRERDGLPSFGRVLQAVANAYRERRAELEASADRLEQAISPAPLVRSLGRERIPAILEEAETRLIRSWDRRFGGFGGAPKFPQLPALEFLLARHARTGAEAPWEVVSSTLAGMRRGGVWDQLGGGLHRYSVDGRWAVPHFEKMLYDNAQLLSLAVHAWQARGMSAHLALAREAARFLAAALEVPGGGFAASLDADTADGEGAYYLWSDAELDGALGPEPARQALDLFGGEGTAELPEGGRVLRGGLGEAELEQRWGWNPAQQHARRRELARLLLRVRSRRPAPGRDPKLVVGWNALAVRALAELAVASGSEPHLARATRTADALLDRAFTAAGSPRHLFDGREARFTATLDDLAGLGLAAVSLHEASGESRWYGLALRLGELVEAEYRDPRGPGWFDLPADHDPSLKMRPRSLEDGAQPSGTALMAELCLRLEALTGEQRWRERAEEVLLALASAAQRFPAAFGSLLATLQQLEQGSLELALVAPPGRLGHWPLLRTARRRLRLPLTVAVASGGSTGPPDPPLTWSRPLLDGCTAYVCHSQVCRRPVTGRAALEAELAAVARRTPTLAEVEGR